MEWSQEIYLHPKGSVFSNVKFLTCFSFHCLSTNIWYAGGEPVIFTVFADIITRKLLDITISKFTYIPKILLKYVDDTFAIIPKDSVDETLGLLNSFHSRSKFTVETEMENQIPYLDVIFKRNLDGTFEIDWYNKCVSSNRILNFCVVFIQNRKYLTVQWNFTKKIEK